MTFGQPKENGRPRDRGTEGMHLMRVFATAEDGEAKDHAWRAIVDLVHAEDMDATARDLLLRSLKANELITEAYEEEYQQLVHEQNLNGGNGEANK